MFLKSQHGIVVQFREQHSTNTTRLTSVKCTRMLENNKSRGKRINRAFSHDATATILVFQNNKTAAILVYQTNPVGVELFSYVNTFFCFNKFA